MIYLDILVGYARGTEFDLRHRIEVGENGGDIYTTYSLCSDKTIELESPWLLALSECEHVIEGMDFQDHQDTKNRVLRFIGEIQSGRDHSADVVIIK